MAERTAIEWTQATWNPVTGCTKISPGCAYCYAERITRRHGGKPFTPTQTEIRTHPERLTWPLKWRQSKMIFTCSMADLFHEAVPFSFISQVISIMKKTPQHIYQVLTKRPDRMAVFFQEWGAAPLNVWLGVSAENQLWADSRIPTLLKIPAKVHFVSCEPLLGPVDLTKWLRPSALNWVIVGGESGGPAKRRLVEPRNGLGWQPKPKSLEWVRELRDQSVAANVAFFFKQWGGPRPTSAGCILDEEIWDGWPGGFQMATSQRVPKWSQAKLKMLNDYLVPYAEIMNKQKRTWLKEFHYIDAFAGPGLLLARDVDTLQKREIKAYLQGSPLLALDCIPRFDRLWFIEQDQGRASSLNTIIQERGEQLRASVHAADANKVIKKIIAQLGSGERGLVFLDPYGLELDWQTVEELGRARIFDVFINFSLMGILRNLSREGEPSQVTRKMLTRVMGRDDWVDSLYSKQSSYLDDTPKVNRPRIDPDKLARIYAEQLETVFEYVSDHIIMRNSKDGPIYALMLASHYPIAKKIMDDIVQNYK